MKSAIEEVLQHGVFDDAGCTSCHAPPLFTNNKLTPAQGFQVPKSLSDTEQNLNVSVGTDPSLAMRTRRGTGFYKVPSLRGVWYRNAFGHMGQAETLEEWFDPARLGADYVPRGFHLEPGPIKGHEFGLNLSQADRRALIAFLRTLSLVRRLLGTNVCATGPAGGKDGSVTSFPGITIPRNVMKGGRSGRPMSWSGKASVRNWAERMDVNRTPAITQAENRNSQILCVLTRALYQSSLNY